MSRVKVIRARQLRKKQTKAEERLWWILRNSNFLGYKFRRQHVFRGFILDFYCPRARLGIEVDGRIHEKQKDYDNARDQILESHGIKIIRFSNVEMLYNSVRVINAILKQLPGLSGLLHFVEKGDRSD
jgi:very-short-patch-repair endonuclease